MLTSSSGLLSETDQRLLETFEAATLPEQRTPRALSFTQAVTHAAVLNPTALAAYLHYAQRDDPGTPPRISNHEVHEYLNKKYEQHNWGFSRSKHCSIRRAIRRMSGHVIALICKSEQYEIIRLIKNLHSSTDPETIKHLISVYEPLTHAQRNCNRVMGTLTRHGRYLNNVTSGTTSEEREALYQQLNPTRITSLITNERHHPDFDAIRASTSKYDAYDEDDGYDFGSSPYWYSRDYGEGRIRKDVHNMLAGQYILEETGFNTNAHYLTKNCTAEDVLISYGLKPERTPQPDTSSEHAEILTF